MKPHLPLSPTSSRVRILYIGGTGRSGSTLLANMLGQYTRFFSAGELTLLFRLGIWGRTRCACGAQLRNCPTWIAIFDAAFGGIDNVDASKMMRLSKRFNSVHLPLMVTKGLRKRLLDRAGELPSILTQLYSGIRLATGRSLIIDSSKAPHYSYILRSQPSLDVFFLHLVRDSRAVAYSWQRRKPNPALGEGRLMQMKGSTRSSVGFDVSNIASELLWAEVPDRYLLVRYEDFVASPPTVLRKIGQFVGENIDPSQIIDGEYVELGATHCAWGNPNRFEHGRIKLQLEDEWRSRMPRPQRVAVTAMTLPLLFHYKYPIRT